MINSKNSYASGLEKYTTSDFQSCMFTFRFSLNMMKEQNKTDWYYSAWSCLSHAFKN